MDEMGYILLAFKRNCRKHSVEYRVRDGSIVLTGPPGTEQFRFLLSLVLKQKPELEKRLLAEHRQKENVRNGTTQAP